MVSRSLPCLWITLSIRLGWFLASGDAQNAKEGKLVKFATSRRIERGRAECGQPKFHSSVFFPVIFSSGLLLVSSLFTCGQRLAGMTALLPVATRLYARRCRARSSELPRPSPRPGDLRVRRSPGRAALAPAARLLAPPCGGSALMRRRVPCLPQITPKSTTFPNNTEFVIDEYQFQTSTFGSHVFTNLLRRVQTEKPAPSSLKGQENIAVRLSS